MSPALLLFLLVAGLLALLPVWRLYHAGWPPRMLLAAWALYSLGIFVGMRFPGPFRLLLPVIIVAYVAPFVAGPERLARVLRGRQPAPGVIIDVTPRPSPGLPEPPQTASAPSVSSDADEVPGSPETPDRREGDR
jgi:hypothetical protein